MKKTDLIKAAEASIKVLLDNPMKETAELIKEVKTEYDGTYSELYSGTLFFHLFLVFTRVQVSSMPNLNISISIFSTASDAKLHNLLSLAVKDVAMTPSPEAMGSSLLVQHQKLMLEHFRHKHTAVLPKDVIQCLLLGVSF